MVYSSYDLYISAKKPESSSIVSKDNDKQKKQVVDETVEGNSEGQLGAFLCVISCTVFALVCVWLVGAVGNELWYFLLSIFEESVRPYNFLWLFGKCLLCVI